jgi:hypothetical protein
MTAVGKAETLFQAMYWQMFKIQYNGFEEAKKIAAKQCALIAAEELEKVFDKLHCEYVTIQREVSDIIAVDLITENEKFWRQVKEEINKL